MPGGGGGESVVNAKPNSNLWALLIDTHIFPGVVIVIIRQYLFQLVWMTESGLISPPGSENTS